MTHDRSEDLGFCERYECERRATMLIVIDAADGHDEWYACYEHCQEFKLWAMEQVQRQGGELQAVEVTRINGQPNL
jgi:hypothetical protein